MVNHEDYSPDPDWIEDRAELKPDNEGDYELEVFLSTDGKHTVKVKVTDPKSRRLAVEKAEAMYQHLIEKYGSKQGTAMKEYAKAGEKQAEAVNPDTCKHEQKTMKQSHTEKNMNRWFETCLSCKKFLGWKS